MCVGRGMTITIEGRCELGGASIHFLVKVRR